MTCPNVIVFVNGKHGAVVFCVRLFRALSTSRLGSNSHGATIILLLSLLSPIFLRGIATPLQGHPSIILFPKFPNPYFAAAATKRVILCTLSTPARLRCRNSR